MPTAERFAKPRLLPLLCLALALAAASPALGAAAASAAEPILGKPRRVSNVRFAAEAATLLLESGVLAPLLAAGEARPREYVFVGKGRLLLRPQDPIEAQQLELFHGEPALDYAFEELALFLPLRAAGDALARRPEATDVDATTAQRLADLHRRWLASGERSVADVDLQRFADDQGHPSAQAYFVAWARQQNEAESARARPLLYIVDPQEREQIKLGRFVAVELEEKEERKVEKLLHREQRRGRLLGLRTEELGHFDTWVSTTRTVAGEPRPGFDPFEPTAYRIAARLDSDLQLHGRAEIDVLPRASGARVLTAQLFRDLVVTSVAVAGQAATFRRNGDTLAIALPMPSTAEQPFTVAIAYDGVFVEKVSGVGHAARDPILWHPHVGEIDRATYDVELRWPKRLDLVAGGARVEGGESGGERWERRRVDRPAPAFGFELGNFEVTEATRKIGDHEVSLRVALDRGSRQFGKERRQQILDAAGDALELYSSKFGPYPYPELTLVTVPRGWSQSLPGLVTLSDLMMIDPGSLLAVIYGLEDRRTVVAHEVAHQWWGHEMGWESYRDQWLSEALASWSSMLYAREKLQGTSRAPGPLSGWQDELEATLADGRPIESVGPLTLGERLASTRAPGAYQAIVYKKGTIVFDMLAQALGRDKLVEALHHLFGIAAGKVISTEILLAAMERSLGADLSTFSAQFVYGTGLPELSYDYTFAPAATAGHWMVKGEVRQRLAHRYRYRVAAVGPAQRLDVVRERGGAGDVAQRWLLVPFRVGLWKPDAPKGDLHVDERGDWNLPLWGQVLIVGESTPFELEVETEPRRFWLDPARAVLATCHDDTQDSKRTRHRQGIEAAAKGDIGTAERLWQEALAAKGMDEAEHRNDELDAAIELDIARLRLDAGDDEGAARVVAQADDRLGRWADDSLRGEVEVLQSRLDLRAGRYEQAYRRLKKVVLRRGTVDSAEAHLLLAVAALHTGDREELAAAVKAAEQRGADVAVLREAAAARTAG